MVDSTNQGGHSNNGKTTNPTLRWLCRRHREMVTLSCEIFSRNGSINVASSCMAREFRNVNPFYRECSRARWTGPIYARFGKRLVFLFSVYGLRPLSLLPPPLYSANTKHCFEHGWKPFCNSYIGCTSLFHLPFCSWYVTPIDFLLSPGKNFTPLVSACRLH